MVTEDQFLRSLRTSHRAPVRVDAYGVGYDWTVVGGLGYGAGWYSSLLRYDLPITGGTVDVDLTGDVRRTITVTLADPSLDPGADPTAILTPYHSELRAFRGVTMPNGSDSLEPLGVFRVESVTTNADGTITVQGADRSVYARSSPFLAPRSSDTAITPLNQVQKLLKEVTPDVTYVPTNPHYSLTMPPVVWMQDRWGAVQDIADSMGVVAYFGTDGQLKTPDPPSISDPIVWTVDTGAQGVIVDWEGTTSRDGAFNCVVVRAERPDGTSIQAVAQDNNVASPTYSGGGYGVIPMFYSSDSIQTQAQADALAATLLNRVRGLSRTMQITCVPNPRLDVGQVISVVTGRAVERHMIDRLTIPLSASEPMTITTRSTAPNTATM